MARNVHISQAQPSKNPHLSLPGLQLGVQGATLKPAGCWRQLNPNRDSEAASEESNEEESIFA